MLSFEDTDDKQMPPWEDGSFLQGLGFAGNNITENNSFLNIVTGADRCIAESRVQGVVNTLNYHVDCSDNRASDWSKQHEGSTSAECTSFLHIVLVSYTTMEQRIRSVNHSLLALRLIQVKQELV